MSTEMITPPCSQAAQAVIALIKKRQGVSMVEISTVLQPLISTRGPYAWEVKPNVALWLQMSKEWCDVMSEVQASGLVEIVPTSLLVYLVDGQAWDLPIAKRLPKAGYKTQHWLPVCFNPKRTRHA